MAGKTRGKMMKIGDAGRTHRMGTGIEIDSIQVTIHGRSLREIMKSENAQKAVNSHADAICDSANSMHSTSGAKYVVHPRVLTVSAHAFIDPENFQAIVDQYAHQTLEKAFWVNQGR